MAKKGFRGLAKTKSQPKTYKGKSMAPGGGGAFAAAVDAMTAKGLPKSAAQAIAAAQGRAKYGKAKFQKMAVVGKKRAAKKKGK